MSTHRNIFNKPGAKKNGKGKGPSLTPKSIFETKSLEPKEKLDIEYYNEAVKVSQRKKEHKFLNHLNGRLLPSNKDIVFKFKDDLQALHRYFDIDPEEGNLNKRLEEIFSLYVSASDLQKLKGNIYKVRMKTEVGTSTGFRIFIFKDFTENKYKIFLIDPLHLVIPSAVQRRENTYDLNKGNSLCISRLFE